jgi:hypothetical protein
LAANHYVFDPEPEILTQHRCCAGEHYCVATNLSTAQQLELQDRLFADMNAWESLTADGQAVRPQQQNLPLVCADFLQIRDLSSLKSQARDKLAATLNDDKSGCFVQAHNIWFYPMGIEQFNTCVRGGNGLFHTFYAKNDHFAKTGSGQR